MLLIYIYGGRRLYQYNEDDFRFKILINIKLLNSMDTQKHGNKEKLSIRKVPLYLLVNL